MFHLDSIVPEVLLFSWLSGPARAILDGSAHQPLLNTWNTSYLFEEGVDLQFDIIFWVFLQVRKSVLGLFKLLHCRTFHKPPPPLCIINNLKDRTQLL